MLRFRTLLAVAVALRDPGGTDDAGRSAHLRSALGPPTVPVALAATGQQNVVTSQEDSVPTTLPVGTGSGTGGGTGVSTRCLEYAEVTEDVLQCTFLRTGREHYSNF